MEEVVDRDIERLKAICGMLTADTDGERSTAAMMATRQLKSMGLTWAQLVESAFSRLDAPRNTRPQPQPGRPHYDGVRPKGRIQVHQGVTAQGALQVLNAWLDDEPELFNAKEQGFIRGLSNQRADEFGLTEAQWKWAISLLIRIQRRAEG